jgi:hypothetical protein
MTKLPLRRGIIQIDALPDSGPGAKARRIAQTTWLSELIKIMDGAQ